MRLTALRRMLAKHREAKANERVSHANRQAKVARTDGVSLDQIHGHVRIFALDTASLGRTASTNMLRDSGDRSPSQETLMMLILKGLDLQHIRHLQKTGL